MRTGRKREEAHRATAGVLCESCLSTRVHCTRCNLHVMIIVMRGRWGVHRKFQTPAVCYLDPAQSCVFFCSSRALLSQQWLWLPLFNNAFHRATVFVLGRIGRPRDALELIFDEVRASCSGVNGLSALTCIVDTHAHSMVVVSGCRCMTCNSRSISSRNA